MDYRIVTQYQSVEELSTLRNHVLVSAPSGPITFPAKTRHSNFKITMDCLRKTTKTIVPQLNIARHVRPSKTRSLKALRGSSFIGNYIIQPFRRPPLSIVRQQPKLRASKLSSRTSVPDKSIFKKYPHQTFGNIMDIISTRKKLNSEVLIKLNSHWK